MKYFLLFLLLAFTVFPQTKINQSLLQTNFALTESKKEFRIELENKINKIFLGPLNSKNEESWRILFGEIGLQFYKSEKIYNGIMIASKYAINGGIKFKRALAEVIITLYPNEFEQTIET